MVEPGEPVRIRIALPRRMQLRGGRTWAAFSVEEAGAARVDGAILGAGVEVAAGATVEAGSVIGAGERVG